MSTGIEMAIKEARDEALIQGQSEALHKVKLVIEQLNKGIPIASITTNLNIDLSMVEEIKRITNS